MAFAVLAVTLFSACSDGGSSPTRPDPQPDPGPAASGTFRIADRSGSQTYSYDHTGNTAFCRTEAGWADLWVRLAEQSTGNGEGGPHLDIDVCGYEGGGSFDPKDPFSTTCSGMTWDVFWHPDPSTSYANTLTSPACSLSIIASGNTLEGLFECEGLREDGGMGEVDVLEGRFQCTVR